MHQVDNCLSSTMSLVGFFPPLLEEGKAIVKFLRGRSNRKTLRICRPVEMLICPSVSNTVASEASLASRSFRFVC
jgi:hypothetical protein